RWRTGHAGCRPDEPVARHAPARIVGTSVWRRRVCGASLRAARERLGRALLLRGWVVPALARADTRCALTMGGRRNVWSGTVVCRGGALLEHRAAGPNTNAGTRRRPT